MSKYDFSDKHWDLKERRQNPRAPLYALILAVVMWLLMLAAIVTVTSVQSDGKYYSPTERLADLVPRLDHTKNPGGHANGSASSSR